MVWWRNSMKAGDIVRLKSGGPKMTVERINPAGLCGLFTSASCTWWDEKENAFYDETFAVDALDILGED